ncbi:DUF1798 family protein [Oceanobacillus polygoni]|uniref:DUF1798 family protein n=1 Tax=Oceanobacillus polygoni TaxID=1235259 RepID=A0A9X0YST0_9BACI|nr:DUF1798 family protein [Oceanobacillus polygoni]MBP2078293.1 hypothetical protein [Oceanobacillus polygoni]
MELKEQTESLKSHLNQLREKFDHNEAPVDSRDRAFFLKVREETLPIYTLLEEWEATALKVVKNREAKVHPHQVASTRENMELLLMHSYYIDARRKRYMELYTSILYVFDLLLEDIS